jgi:hypothetical protein
VTVWVLIIVVVLAAAAIVITIGLRNRAAHSSVDSFRRQIDALGPAARRTVVDQVQSVAGRDAEPDAVDRDDAADGAADDDAADDDAADDGAADDGEDGEDGARDV